MLSFRRRQIAVIIGLLLSLKVFPSYAENPIALDALVVEDRKLNSDETEEQHLTPGGVTVLETTDLYERKVSNLADMLRYVPGIWVAGGTTGDSAFFSSRGSNLDATNYDGNGIKLLQDGLPVTAADGSNHNRAVDPLSASRAVIARGANALTLGASTLGGAIDFISPTARNTDSQLYLSGGSDDELQGRITTGSVLGDFDGLVTLEAKTWQGYRDHHEQERLGVYANAGWQFNDAVETRFYFTYLDNDQELPGVLTKEQFRDDPYQAQPEAVLGNYLFNVETWRAANKTVWEINDNSSLSLGFSYEEQDLCHPIVYSPFFSLLIDTKQDNAGTALRYNLNLGDHNLLAGLDYAESTVKGGNYSHEGGRRKELMTRVDNRADSLELFLVDRWNFATEWTLVYGAQAVFAGREVKNTDVATNSLYNPRKYYRSLNPRVGIIYQLTSETELFGNISRLYEPPTNYELEDDTSPDNKALRAMRGEVVEIGSRGHHLLGSDSAWHWELALYYAQLNDEILSVDDPEAPGTSLSTNVDDTIHAGVEALVGADFAIDVSGYHRLEPLVNLTLNKFSFDSDPVYGNNKLPVAPDYAIKGEVIYRNDDGFFAGPTIDIIDKRYADFSNTYSVSGYTLLGLRAGFRGESWEVFGEARNLTDKEYVSVFSVKDIASPDAAILQAGEPRALYLGMRLLF